MIDLHCHILPQMDDGSPDIEETMNMIRLAERNDINVIVATPHFTNYDAIEDFVDERNIKAVDVNRLIKEQGYNVVIACGAEVFLSSEIFTADSLDRLTINGSKYLLCEYTLQPIENEKALVYAEEVVSRGYIPIIAHPERYPSFYEDPTVVNELWDMGCRFQINASGLAGHGGREMQSFSLDLIRRGFVAVIATDAHSSTFRNNKIISKIGEFPEELTKQEIENLIDSIISDC